MVEKLLNFLKYRYGSNKCTKVKESYSNSTKYSKYFQKYYISK